MGNYNPVMGFVYRPVVTEYRLANGKGKRVKKGTPGATKVSRRSRVWRIVWRDADGHDHEEAGGTRKSRAEELLAEYEARARVERATGVRAEQKTLADYLKDYEAALKAEGDCAAHVKKQISYARAVLDFNKWSSIEDMRPSGVQRFVLHLQEATVYTLPGSDPITAKEIAVALGVAVEGVLKAEKRGILPPGDGKGASRAWPLAAALAYAERHGRGAGNTTCNHYITAVKCFARWLVKDRRTVFNPLEHLSHLNEQVDRRHQRRALTEAEFARVIEATAAGDAYFELTGPARLVLYTLAANTGFRAGELASLKPESFTLDATPPTVAVDAAYSKRRRKDSLPLRVDVADMMQQYLVGRPRGVPVFPGNWHERGAEMLRGDLERAGVPYRDDQGRVYDFHALRGQFVSALAAAGVHPKVAQELARHSDINLTMNHYTHLDPSQRAEAVNKLPGIKNKEGEK